MVILSRIAHSSACCCCSQQHASSFSLGSPHGDFLPLPLLYPILLLLVLSLPQLQIAFDIAIDILSTF